MRKLAAFSIAFSAAIFAANYIISAAWLIPCAAVLAAAGVITLIRRRKLPTIILFAAAIGLCWFFGHYLITNIPAKHLDGFTGEVCGTVTDYPTDGDSYTSFEVKLDSEHSFGLNARIYDYSHDSRELRPGQRVSFSAKLRSADTRYGETDPYYNAKDLYITGTYKSDLRVISEKKFYLPALPAYIGRAVSEKVEELFPTDTAPFMKALLIGDRSDFYDDVSVTTAFGHAGFMHVVAVSGMHIGFLIGMLLMIMGHSPRGSVISIAIIWIFALASGASPSVIRAGFMQTVLLLAPIFRREDDPVTTLSFALMVILMENPYSAASLSLQLSFSAVAGIILFAEKLRAAFLRLINVKKPNRLLNYAAGIVSGSVSVLILSAPLTALYFGYIQTLGIVTNLLGLWAVSLCFSLGLFACMAGFAFPIIGRALALAASIPARHVLALVKLIAGVPYCAVYLNRALMMIWLIIAYSAFIIFVLSILKPWQKLAIPTVISLSALIIIVCGVGLWYRAGTYYNVLDVGQGQCIAVFDGNRTVMVDCGGKAVASNPGTIAGRYIKSCGRNRIDTLIITHAHADHANGVEQLMELSEIGRIVMPQNSEQSSYYDNVVEAAARHGTELLIVSEDITLTEGNINAFIVAPLEGAKDNDDSLMLTLSVGDYDMLITGDSPAKSERRLLRDYDIEDIELYMVAHHGSKYSNIEELLEHIGADEAVISVGYNSYGHPTEEVLERLTECGYNIRRTDEDGNIQIRIDRPWLKRLIRTNKN